MARIAGIDIPTDKQVQFSLSYIYGIGRVSARKILDQTGIPPERMVRDLGEDDVVRLRSVIEGDYMVEGDLRRDVRQNIQRLIEVNCYRGARHRRGLPVRGQRTKTNARSRRGRRRAVAGNRKAAVRK